MAVRKSKCKTVSSSVTWVAITVVFLLPIFRPIPVLCEPITGSEYEVKLGFIYNFINFVTWPKTAFKKKSDPLVMCIVSDNSSSEVLYKLDGKRIKQRKIKVIAYQEETCPIQGHILFFATRDMVLIQQVLEQTKGLNILTIGEADGFARAGGMIGFFVEDNRLRFRVNIDAVRENALKMSSQLLVSAQIVSEADE
jgi:hypothetical protein